MELDTVSICVKDMDRALEFYIDFFGKQPERKDERFSFFELGNVTFGMYNPSADNESVEYGENCVAAFKTEDLEEERQRLKQLAPWVEEIQDLGSYRLFHFKDTEGNLLEIYEGEK